MDVLRLVPGLHLGRLGAESSGAAMQWRGFDIGVGGDLEVRILGAPLNEHSGLLGHGQVTLDFIPVELLAGLEVQPGPYDLDQGDHARAGTVDLELGLPAGRRGTRLTYAPGTSSRHRLLALSADRDADEQSFAAVEALVDDGFGEGRATRRLNVLMQGRVTEGLVVAGAAGLSRGDRMTPVRLDDARGGVSELGDAADIGRQEADRTLLVAQHRIRPPFDRALDLRTTAWFQWQRRETDDNPTGQLEFPEAGDRTLRTGRSITVGGRMVGTRRLGRDLQLRILGAWRLDDLEQRVTRLDASGAPFLRTLRLDAEVHRAALGPSARWRPFRWLSLEGALRMDVIHTEARDAVSETESRETFTVAAPRFTASSPVGGGLRFYLAGGRGYRSTDVRALLQPGERIERRDPAGASEAELGFRWRIGDGVDFGANTFGAELDGQRVYEPLTGRARDQPATTVLGAELDAQVAFGRRLSVQFGAVFAETTEQPDEKAVDGIAPAVGSAGVVLDDYLGIFGAVHVRYVGARRYEGFGELPEALVGDATLGYRWGPLEVELAVSNIGEVEHWEVGEVRTTRFAADDGALADPTTALYGWPGPPRLFRLGVTVWLDGAPGPAR